MALDQPKATQVEGMQKQLLPDSPYRTYAAPMPAPYNLEESMRELTNPEPSPVVLLVENDVLTRLALASDLRLRGLQVFEAVDATEAMIVLEKIVVDVVLSDASLFQAAELVQWVKEHELPTRFVWTTGHTFQQTLRQLQS